MSDGTYKGHLKQIGMILVVRVPWRLLASAIVAVPFWYGARAFIPHDISYLDALALLVDVVLFAEIIR